MGDAVADHPDDEKLDDSHAAMTEATRQRQRTGIVEMSLVAGAAILIAVSTMFSAWNTFELRKLHKTSLEERQLIRLGTECMVAELSDHRHLTGLAHRANAADHGYTYPIAPDSEPPVIPEVLESVCKVFLQTTTTSRP